MLLLLLLHCRSYGQGGDTCWGGVAAANLEVDHLGVQVPLELHAQLPQLIHPHLRSTVGRSGSISGILEQLLPGLRRCRCVVCKRSSSCIL